MTEAARNKYLSSSCDARVSGEDESHDEADVVVLVLGVVDERWWVDQ